MKIKSNVVPFDDSGEAVVTLPLGSTAVALRFYLEHPLEPPGAMGPAINIIVSIDDAGPQGRVQRKFIMVPTDEDLPEDFIKWIATVPRPDNSGQIVHVIEVEA